jgi:hypothetical protein
MDRLLNFTAALSLCLILLVLASLRRSHIRVEYSVSWLAAAVAMLALSRSRGLLQRVADLLGIADPPLALFLLGGCVFLFILFRYSVILSRLRDDNIALAQRMAILEHRLGRAQAE